MSKYEGFRYEENAFKQLLSSKHPFKDIDKGLRDGILAFLFVLLEKLESFRAQYALDDVEGKPLIVQYATSGPDVEITDDPVVRIRTIVPRQLWCLEGLKGTKRMLDFGLITEGLRTKDWLAPANASYAQAKADYDLLGRLGYEVKEYKKGKRAGKRVRIFGGYLEETFDLGLSKAEREKWLSLVWMREHYERIGAIELGGETPYQDPNLRKLAKMESKRSDIYADPYTGKLTRTYPGPDEIYGETSTFEYQAWATAVKLVDGKWTGIASMLKRVPVIRYGAVWGTNDDFRGNRPSPKPSRKDFLDGNAGAWDFAVRLFEGAAVKANVQEDGAVLWERINPEKRGFFVEKPDIGVVIDAIKAELDLGNTLFRVEPYEGVGSYGYLAHGIRVPKRIPYTRDLRNPMEMLHYFLPTMESGDYACTNCGHWPRCTPNEKAKGCPEPCGNKEFLNTLSYRQCLRCRSQFGRNTLRVFINRQYLNHLMWIDTRATHIAVPLRGGMTEDVLRNLIINGVNMTQAHVKSVLRTEKDSFKPHVWRVAQGIQSFYYTPKLERLRPKLTKPRGKKHLILPWVPPNQRATLDLSQFKFPKVEPISGSSNGGDIQ